MWDFMTNLMPGRRNGSGTMTAMVVGAGIGIAAWEMLKRNNTLGMVAKQARNNTQGSDGGSDQQS